MERRAALVAVLALGGFVLAAAAPSSWSDGGAATQADHLQGGLQAAIGRVANDSGRPTWILYEVSGVNPNFHRCCACDNEPVACRLDEDADQSVIHDSDDERGGSGRIRIALRVAGGTVDRVRFYSGDCELDTGGEGEVRLAGIEEAESISLLAQLMEDEAGESGSRPRPSTVLSAIAMHAGEAADEAMERFVAPDQPTRRRKRAAFWLGAARGGRGFETLRRLARDEEDDPQFRKELVFAIHVSKEPQVVDELIRLARRDGSKQVRKQALFWLGQRAGKRAVAALEDAVENDPDTEIQKSAVFALSQLPQEEGTPLLMRIARTHSNPKVRKQAFFWLGQSGDPRALEFFEQVLTQ